MEKTEASWLIEAPPHPHPPVFLLNRYCSEHALVVQI